VNALLPPEPQPVAAEGPMRATLRPDGRYADYYILRQQQTAWSWPVVPEWVYVGRAAND
jgi:hypothetical protein